MRSGAPLVSPRGESRPALSHQEAAAAPARVTGGRGEQASRRPSAGLRDGLTCGEKKIQIVALLDEREKSVAQRIIIAKITEVEIEVGRIETDFLQ